MASGVNPIVIQITDGIDSTVAAKITAIGTAADVSYKQVESLKLALTSINSGTLQGLKTQLDSTQSSTTQLQTTLSKLTATNQGLASSTTQVASANVSATQSTINAATAATNLSAARSALNLATKNLTNAQQQLGQSAAAGNLQAQGIIAGYQQQQTAAAKLVVQLKAAQLAQNQFTRQQQNVGNSGHASVSGVQAASAAIRGLEGNFGTSVRAGERFLVTTLKLGPVLQAAFPIFGALALVGILSILYDHIQNLIRAFKQFNVEALKLETDSLEAGDRIIKAKRESLLSAFNVARLISGAPSQPETLEVTNAREALKELEWKKQIALVDAENLEKGKTGLALQKQKEASLALEIQLTKDEQAAAGKLRDTYKAQLDAKVQINRNTIDNVTYPFRDLVSDKKVDVSQPKFAPVLSDPKLREAVGEQLKVSAQGFRDLGHEAEVLEHRMSGLKLKEPLMAAHDATKAAREQLKQFTEEYAHLQQTLGRPITPQDKITLFTKQSERALPPNKPVIDSRLGVATQEQERQIQTVELLTERLNDQKTSIGEYSDALRAKNQWDKIDLQLKKDNITLTEDQTKGLQDTIKYIAENGRYERELKSTYEEFNGTLKTYEAALKAANDLEAKGVITKEQATIATRQANLAYDNAKNPLSEYNIGLQNQIDLLGKYGVELTVSTELQRVQNELRLRGRVLSETEGAALKAQLTSLERQKEIQSQVNRMYEENIGQVEQLIRAQTALTEAKQKGLITGEQEQVGLAKTKVAIAQLKVEMHQGTGTDLLKSVVGSYLKDFEGLTKGTTKLYDQMFSTIADGAAQSLGRALVYGEDLSAALKDVARSAISELISGLIKLGIQFAIVTALEDIFKIHLPKPQEDTTAQTAKNTAVAVASILAVTLAEFESAQLLEEPLWSIAEAVSLASFGANAIGAVAGIESVVAAADTARHFNKGGLVPGFGSTDTVHAMLTPGEFILKQTAVQNIGLANVQALNDGATSKFVQHSATTGYNGYGAPIVNIIHDGSTHVVVEKTSSSEIRIIAKREAEMAVEQHAPRVVANDMRNPNSQTSKVLKRTKTVKELR